MKLKYINIYKNILKEYETLSTCARLQVAALLVKDGRILSVGYNGTSSGKCHCTQIFKFENGTFMIQDTQATGWHEVSEAEWRKRHHEFSETSEVHAEMNCLAFALRNNISIKDCSIIVSIAPCSKCAKFIGATGIKHVYYVNKYDAGDEGILYLQSLGVDVRQIDEVKNGI